PYIQQRIHIRDGGCFFFGRLAVEKLLYWAIMEMQLVSAIPAEGRFVVRLYFSGVSYQGLWKNTKTV
ncbi:hypothetical protein CEXT_729941, partial [Caerostris extrusa]